MSYIYISHAENEEKIASQLKQYLKFTFETWCPFDDVPFGSDLSAVIPQKIKEASAMLVILSEKSKNSRQFFRELHLADKYSIPVIPVSYGKVEMTEATEYYFSGVNIMDISALESDLSCLNAIMSELKKYGGRKDYDELIDVSVEEETESPLPLAEDTSSLREKIRDIASALPSPIAETATDYDNIAATEEFLSSLLEKEGISAELSLATEGPSFTRYIYNVPYHTTEDNLLTVKEVLAQRYENADCYLTEDNGGAVIELPKAEKAVFGILPFLKSEGFLSTKAPTLIAGKDVNENCIFIPLEQAKVLLVIGDDLNAREKFLDLCYLSLRAKFTEKEMQVKSCNSVESGLEDLDPDRPAVLLLTDVEEEGLYDSLQALPENVYAVVEAEAEDIEDLKKFPYKVVFYRQRCSCRAHYLSDGELIFKTPEFKVRALMPVVTEEEGEALLIAADKHEQPETQSPETDEVSAPTESEPEQIAFEEKEEEPAIEVELTVDDVPVADITEEIFPAEEEIEIDVTVEDAPAEEEVPSVEETPVAEEPAVEETPAAEVPVEETPVAEEPAVEETPAAEVPAEETPVAEEPAVEETPAAEEVPVEETPVAEEPAVEETPVAEEPAVEETPVEEAPAETIIEEPVAEEPAVEETPVAEEIPVEETPVEEAPAPVWTKVPEEERPSELYLRALKIFVTRKAASISILQQRPLLMNYTKANEIYLWMASKGYISEPDELGYRKLLIDEEDYKTLYE